MALDLTSLSAKELYELAQQKEQEETQKVDGLRQQISDKEARRDQLLTKQSSELAVIDTQIQEWTQRRRKLAERYTQVIGAIEEEVVALKAEYQSLTEPTDAQVSAPAETVVVAEQPPVPEAESSAPVAKPADDEKRVAKAIIGTLKGRSYISETLLKEKLTAQGFANPFINAALTNMLKQKSLLRKGGSNYALGTIPASLR